uniref:Uncharacterized protein n=1 Tax=Chrysotila carterae TaxID=13221 RepID=A0A7S4ETY0_CHRCT
MVRGHAKEEAQKRNAAKNVPKKGTQRGDAEKKLTVICPQCKAQMPGYALLAQHYDGELLCAVPKAEPDALVGYALWISVDFGLLCRSSAKGYSAQICMR